MAVNSTMQNLLNAYTGNIKVDPRVFGTDVMGYDQFAAPFDEWARQFADTYMRPEFLRNQYDPYMEQTQNQLGNMNQQIGLSGGWRTGQAAADLDAAARQGILGGEQLWQGFNDQVLGVRDQLKQSWVDPLYQSRLTNWYEAPWRNANTGTPNPQLNTTLPNLNGFQPGNSGIQQGVQQGQNMVTTQPIMNNQQQQQPQYTQTPQVGSNNLLTQYLLK